VLCVAVRRTPTAKSIDPSHLYRLMSEISSRARITAIRVPAITDFAVDGISSSDAAIEARGQALSACDNTVLGNPRGRMVAVDAIVAACSAASLAAGFPEIELRPVSDKLVRLIALNAASQALVSEVHIDEDGASVATEVVGVRDGSCARILDKFDGALEAAGIRSAAPQRKFTGGIAELAGAKETLRRFTSALKPAKLSVSQPQPSADAAHPRRAARANTRNRGHQ